MGGIGRGIGRGIGKFLNQFLIRGLALAFSKHGHEIFVGTLIVVAIVGLIVITCLIVKKAKALKAIERLSAHYRDLAWEQVRLLFTTDDLKTYTVAELVGTYNSQTGQYENGYLDYRTEKPFTISGAKSYVEIRSAKVAERKKKMNELTHILAKQYYDLDTIFQKHDELNPASEKYDQKLGKLFFDFLDEHTRWLKNKNGKYVAVIKDVKGLYEQFCKIHF